MQVNFEPASFEVKVNFAFRLVVDFFGFVLIVVRGGVVSPGWLTTVKDLLAGVGSVFPDGSVALTLKVWEPRASVPVVRGLVHEVKVPESTWHSKLLPFSLEVNSKVGVVSLVWPPGRLVVIVVSGGVVSGVPVATVKLREAWLGSALPAESVA